MGDDREIFMDLWNVGGFRGGDFFEGLEAGNGGGE